MTAANARIRAKDLRRKAASLLGEAAALDGYADQLEMAPVAPQPQTKEHRAAIAAATGKRNPLARAIAARGETMTEAAKKLGISPSFLSLVGNGHRTPSGELAGKLFDRYGWRP